MPFAISPTAAVNPSDCYRAADNSRAGRSRPEHRPASRFEGNRVDYQSGEAASLEVKTEDGDTVQISFAALNRIQAGAYAAYSEGASAVSHSVAAESSVQVQVSVNGSLDDKEVRQIGHLLSRLVSKARSGEPPQAPAGRFSSLEGFQFAYNAYRQSS